MPSSKKRFQTGYLDPLQLSTSSSTSSLPLEERAVRAEFEKSEAERRLKEAEDKLRLAIEDLHHSQIKSSRYKFFFYAKDPLCTHADSCIANAMGSLCQSFLLAYGVRVGIGVVMRAFKLFRNKPFSALDLQLLLSEKNLVVREEACRIGLFFGGFTGSYHMLKCILRRIRGKESPFNSFLCGCISGLSILSLDDSNTRRSLSLYLFTRILQCMFSSTAAKHSSFLSKFKFKFENASMLLFCLSSAQIMYAYVMHKSSLHPSFWSYLVKTGPIPEPVLQAVHDTCRNVPVDLNALNDSVLRNFKADANVPSHSNVHVDIIPCKIMHPATSSCIKNDITVFIKTFKKSFSLYLSLSLVPFVILNIQKFMHSPIQTAIRATLSAVRSTSFLSLFVSSYQGLICLHRKVAEKDNKLVYWVAGFLAGFAATSETPAKRKELAMYTIPKALDSIFHILIHRKYLPRIKYSEVFLFSVCMGFLMYFYENEPKTLPPFLKGILSRFLNKTGSPLSDPTIGTLISPAYNLLHKPPPNEIWPPLPEVEAMVEENVEPNPPVFSPFANTTTKKEKEERRKLSEEVLARLGREAFHGL